MEKKPSVYVYVKNTKTSDFNEIEVTVYDSLEKARAALKKDRDAVIDYWRENADIIGSDTEDCFEAWDDQYTDSEHTKYYVEKREIL